MLIINDMSNIHNRGIEVKIVGFQNNLDRLTLWSTLNNKLLDYWNAIHIPCHRNKHGLIITDKASIYTATLVMQLILPQMNKQIKNETLSFLRNSYKYASQMLRGTVMDELYEVPVYSSLLPDYKEGEDPIVHIAFSESQLMKYWVDERLDTMFADFADYIENCTAECNKNLL